MPVDEFYTGVKQHAGRPDELITAVWIRPADRSAAVQQDRHPQRDGDRGRGRSALALHPGTRRVGTGIGSAAPTPRRAVDAEDFLAGELDWARPRRRWRPSVAGSSAGWSRPRPSPIDDVRGTAAYRRHALAVMARPMPGLGLGRATGEETS